MAIRGVLTDGRIRPTLTRYRIPAIGVGLTAVAILAFILTERLSGKGSDPLPSRPQTPQYEAKSLQKRGGLTPFRIASERSEQPEEKAIATNSQVKTIHAELIGDWVEPPEIPMFRVPDRNAKLIGDLLATGRIQKRKEVPAEAVPAVRLRIEWENGAKSHAELFFSGKGPMLFRVDGIEYLRGGKALLEDSKGRILDESAIVCFMISEARPDLSGTASSKSHQHSFDLLKRLLDQ